MPNNTITPITVTLHAIYKGMVTMRKVEKYIKLYKADKVTPQQARKQLGGRLYKEWWDTIAKQAEKGQF